MDKDELDSITTGFDLHTILLSATYAMQRKTWERHTLHRNNQTSGFFISPVGKNRLLLTDYTPGAFLTVGFLDQSDEAICLALLRETYALAAFADYVTNDLAVDTASNLTDLTITALAQTLESAINEIARITPPLPEIQNAMPLTGTLPAVLKYMGLLFDQHGYEFLNIAFNGANLEYELLTPAEVSKLNNTGAWADRRMVITCTRYELEHLRPSAQIPLPLAPPSDDNA